MQIVMDLSVPIPSVDAVLAARRVEARFGLGAASSSSTSSSVSTDLLRRVRFGLTASSVGSSEVAVTSATEARLRRFLGGGSSETRSS